MKTFDVQSVGIKKPNSEVFGYIAKPENLPAWTNAFSHADSASAELVTPNGSVPIKLATIKNNQSGTIDWKMTFPDGQVAWAFSRVTPDGDDKSIYSFVLMPPPVPLELLEGALNEQIKTLAKELIKLKKIIEE